MAKLIFNEDLTEYRALEMMEGAKILRLLEQEKVPVEYYRGAMAMLKKIIELPRTLADKKDEGQIEIANDLIKRGLAEFEKQLMRKSLDDNSTTE
jgi:dissimilatory sulfite reductase (desulfoviridin) alpha/beta subunit